MATRHRLRPLLYYNLNSICPEKVPEDVLSGLKEFYQDNVRKNLMLTGELIKVMELLENNGIKAFTYKGPVLAAQAYGNIGLREFGDIDIFIDKEDALKVKDLMIGNGYELYPHLNFKDDEYYLKFVTEHRFINKNNGTIIEIKWKFEGDFFSFPVNSDFLKAKKVEYPLNGFTLITFSSFSELLILSVHSAKHDWTKLSWICDISEFIKKERIDWKKVIEDSHILSINRILFTNLILARDLFDLRLPEEIEHQLKTDVMANKMSLQVKKRIFIGKNSLNLFQKFFLDLIKRENTFYGIKDCFNSFIRPGYRDFKDFPLPKQLFPLYHLIRPFLLLKRYGKGPL